MSHVRKLHKKGLIKPPPFVVGGIQYETIMGSEAYGVSSGTSDRDVYGFCIPARDMVFPHLRGEIPGFGQQKKRFDQWSQDHVLDRSDVVEGEPREYDFAIYNIVKYFQLCMENNPNMLDSLFTPARCVLHSTKIADMVRDRRKDFLHKGAWHKFRGYSFSQMNKIRNKDIRNYVTLCREFDLDPLAPLEELMVDKKLHQPGDSPMYLHFQALYGLMLKAKNRGGWGKRLATVVEHGFDVKHAYHVVRLLGEIEQILTTGDLDLTRDRERLKAIRRGEWTLERIEEFFASKEKALEGMYENSELPWGPDEEAIKRLLLDCLEEHYGDLSSAVVQPDRAVGALRRIRDEVDNVRGLL